MMNKWRKSRICFLDEHNDVNDEKYVNDWVIEVLRRFNIPIVTLSHFTSREIEIAVSQGRKTLL